MNQDFVTRLGVALREAADREERRRAPARAALASRAYLQRVAPANALLAFAMAGVVAIAVAAVIALRPQPAQPPQAKVVARLTPGGALDGVAAGFGAGWVTDTTDDALLRIDPVTRRVTARIPLRGGIAAAAGGDAMWVGEQINDLLRIDPRTNRIVARITMPASLSGGVPMPIGDAVWVVGEQRAVRVDARTNRVTKTITIARRGYAVRWATRLGGDLWMALSDGRLLHLDGRTGAREAAFRPPFVGLPAGLGGGLFLADTSQVARLDPQTGRILWRKRIDHIGGGAAMRGLVWAEAPGRDGDQLIAIDPRNGQTVAHVHVGEFGAMTLERVGSELWLTTAGGHLVIIRP